MQPVLAPQHRVRVATLDCNAWQVVYILTLGVVEGARRRGVAKQLLRLVLSAARSRGCRACFLHVITYNHDAISFYLANSFQQLAQLREFYHISCALLSHSHLLCL